MNEDLKQIPFKIFIEHQLSIWTLQRLIKSKKDPIFKSNDLILLTYKVSSLGLIDANISWEWTKEDGFPSL